MHPLIVFSGGLDSTLLLYMALQQGNVDVLYIEGGQDEHKVAAEDLARERIIPVAERLAGRGIVVNRERRRVRSLASGPEMIFTQAPAWILGMLMTVDPRIHSEVQLGYLMCDQIMVHREDFVRSWDAMCRLSKHPPYVPVKFPFVYRTKEEILQMLPWELQQLTWSCESPLRTKAVDDSYAYQPCKRCVACITQATEHHRFELTHGKSVEVWHAEREDFLRRTDDLIVEDVVPLNQELA